MPRPQPPDDRDWHDLQPLLDEELSRLPDRYRVPVVLCDLEGRGRQEVARQLGVPAGTLSSRLARARALLAGRLARRGVTVTGAALAVALTRQAASAALPPSLIVATLKAGTLVLAGQAVTAGTVPAHVAALTEGALRAMFLTRLKTATAVLFVGTTLALGLGQFAAGRLDAQFFTPARPRNNAPSTPDTPGAWEAEIKYPLKYLKASGAILSLTRALGDKQGAPVRVSADDRTNTLFLQGPADEVADLLKFVRRLDEAAKERVSAVDELVPPDRTAPAAEEPLPARVKRLERELQQWQERVKKLEKEVAGLRAERLQEKTDDAAKKALDEYLQPPPRKK